MIKIDYRSYIKTCVRLNINAVTIANELKVAYGDQAPKYRYVAKCAATFKTATENPNDDPHSKCPKSVFTSANNERVRKLIQSNPYVSCA